MIHRWSVLCKRSVVDSTTNQISLFDVVEKIEADVEVESMEKLKNEGKGIIAIPISLELVSYITGIDSDKHQGIEMRLTLIDSNGEQLQESFPTFDTPENTKNMRIRMGIQGMPVKEKGMYFFNVWLKENEGKDFVSVAEIPIEIDIHIREKR